MFCGNEYCRQVSNYVPGHNLSHHRHMQGRRDVMRTTKLRFKWHFLNGALFFAKIGFDMLGNDAKYFEAGRYPRIREELVERISSSLEN